MRSGLVVLAVCLTTVSVSFAEGPVPLLDLASTGDLAVRTADDAVWRAVMPGQPVPAQALFRLSSRGGCVLSAAGDTLRIASGTRGTWDLEQRTLRLESLRPVSAETAIASVSGKAPWTVTVRNTSLAFSAGAEGFIGLPIADTISVVLKTGKVAFAGGPENTVEAEPREFVWNGVAVESRGVSEQRLAAAQAAWTDGARARARQTGLGRLTARDPQSSSPGQPLPISRQRVNLVLQAPVGLVQIDQSFFNPQAFTVEATFEFELPEGASVSRFAMFTTPTTLIEGELIPREKANNVYTSIVNRRNDPAILEQIGRNLFRMRVFPIFAREHKRILLDYTVPLTPRDGQYEFRLPLTRGEHPLGSFRLTGAIPQTGDVQLASPTHPDLQIVPGDDQVRFSFAKERYTPESDLVLNFRQEQTSEVDLRTNVQSGAVQSENVGGNVQVTPPPGDGAPRTYFLATLRPDILEQSLPRLNEARLAQEPVDVLIVADTSGGQRGRRTLRALVRMLAEELPEGSRVRLGCVDATYRALTPEWLAAGSKDIPTVLDQFEQELFLGGTSFFNGLAEAVKSLGAPEDGRRRTLVYVGDGLLPWGTSVNTLPRIQADLHASFINAGCSFTAVHVGRESEAFERLENLCGPTGGCIFPVLTSATASSDLFAWIQNGLPSQPVIDAIEVEGVDPADLIAPAVWRRGEPLTVLGRLAPRKELRLKLALRGTPPREWTLPVTTGTDYFVGRAWAQGRLERLGLEHALAKRSVSSLNGASERLVAITQQMEQLSQEWTVLCPTTAFLVLETEADYARWQIDRKRRHTYWKPAEAVEFGEQLILPEFEQPGLTLRQGFGPVGGWTPPPPPTPSQRRRQFLQTLGQQRPWFDPTARADGLPPGSLFPLLSPGFQVSSVPPSHPDAWRAKIVTPPDELTLLGLRNWLAVVTGKPVNLHANTFLDEGVPLDKPFLPKGIRKMSVNGVLEFARQAKLGWWTDDVGVHLSTAIGAGSHLQTELYPVADLLFSTERTEWSQLVNPLLDIELAAEERLNKKLEKPVSLDFTGISLNDVLGHLSAQIDDNVVIDSRTLEDEGIDLKQIKTTITVQDVPLRGALKWVNEPAQLTAIVWNESLLITTATQAGNLTVRTRLYPTVGLLFETAPPEEPDAQPQRFGRGGRGFPGGAFGGGGGFGFGGFGGLGGGVGFGGAGGGQVPTFGMGPAGIGMPDLLAEPDDESVARAGSTNEDDQPQSDPDPFLGIDFLGGFGIGGGTGADFTPLIDLVTSTIDPDSWEDVGGAGSVREFEMVPCLVMRITDAAHRQTLDLFRRLRKIKPVGGSALHRQLTLPHVTPRDRGAFDFGPLIELLTTTVNPDTWDEVGGAGSVREFAAQGALSVRQTRESHDEIRRLLTLLRRTRVAIQSGLYQQPDFDPFAFSIDTATPFITHLPDAVPLDQLPAPEEAELTALSVRHEPNPGASQWTRAERGLTQRTALVRDGDRWEVDLDGRRARFDHLNAAVDHAGLQIVDVGPWAESVRTILDARLPWLPHRTNAELAQLFRIKELVRDDQSVTLQFVRWEDTERPDTDLRGTFSKTTGRPTRWEARVDGQLTLRLQFDEHGVVLLETADGTEQARWMPEKTTPEATPLPALAEQWSAVPEGRGASPRLILGTWPGSSSAVLRDILAAIGRAELRAAHTRLSHEVTQADHPLWRLLRAWCHEQDPSLGTPDEFRADLRAVVASPAGDLRAYALSEAFLSVSVRDRALLAAVQPAETMTAGDFLRRARLARQLKDAPGAVDLLEQAVQRDSESLAANIAEAIEIYFDAKRIDTAVQHADTLASNPVVPVDVLVSAGSALFQVGQRDASARVFAKALAREDLLATERAAVLVRRAATEPGKRRWRSLLAARDLLDVKAVQRTEIVETIFAELQKPHLAPVAGELAREVTDPELATRFLWEEVTLTRTVKPAEAANLAWTLYQAGQLPTVEEPWLAQWLEHLGRHADCIQLLESRLRAGRNLTPTTAQSLAQAYRLTNRPDMALRAWTHSIELTGE